MVTQLLKRQFTTQDYHQMVVAGILSSVNALSKFPCMQVVELAKYG